jgi:ABC-type multidrug transport system ATPase subunit
MRHPGHQVVLQVRNLSYSVPSGKRGVLPRQILSKVNLTLNSGKVIALMGPSGAGKTTLLNILAQRSMAGKIQGQVLVNNMDVSKVPAYKAIVGYVY